MSFIVTRSRSKLGLGENISKDSVQSDSQREIARESPASESDSGDSLFLTQSVTSPSRTVKRHHPSNDPPCPFSQEVEDVHEKAGGRNAQHKDTGVSSDSDSETTYDVLLRRWKLLANSRGRINQRPRPSRKRVSPKWMGVPFLKKSVSVRKKQTIVNSEVGGFFKCILKLSKGHGDKRRGELSPSLLLSERKESSMQTEDDDDDEDVKKVDKDCFIENTHKRNQQTWLPSLKWKTRQAPETCTKKSNKCQEEQETCSQTRKVAEDLMAPQDDADVYNESSSLNIEVSRSTENGEKSRKSAEWNWMEPIDETSDEETQRPNLVDQDEDETQILQDNPMDREGREDAPCLENISSCEHQVQVQDIHQGVHHEPLGNETQILQDNPTDKEGKEDAPCLENISSCEHQVQVQDIHQGVHHEPLGNETQILQDNPTDKEGKEDALCFENISSCEHQVQVQDIHQSVHHEPLENEDFGSVSGGFISSQDLFQEPNNQSSPLKETSVENDKEVLESIVVPHDDIGLIIKKKGSLILEDMEGDFLKYSKSLRTHPSEIVSPTAGDICQVRKEKDKTTLDMQDPHHHSSLPLEDYESGSIGNDYSSCSKDILMVRQEEKTETPLFNFGGLKFLKRKKNKKTKDPEISDNLAPRQADLGQNEYSALHFDDVKRKKRRKVKNDRLLEETVYTLPDISIAADSSLLVQDSSVVCASVSGSKPKRKKGKNDWLLEEPVDTLPDISVAADSSLSVQDSSVVCATVSGSKAKKKRKKDKNDRLLEEPVDTLPDISVAADSSLSVQDSSVVCASVSGSKPKRKKGKNYRLLEEPVDTLPDISVAADSSLSVQDSSVVCASISGSKAKKKRKKDKNDRLLEEPVDTLPDISVAADSSLSLQDSSVVCASVSGSKPKSKKDKNDRLLEEPVDTLPDISVAADSGLSVQDSSVVCASVNGIKPKKKRKKDKHGQPVPQEDEWIGVEEAIQIPCQGSGSLVSIAEETEQLTRTDLSNFVQSDCLEPQRKKKKKRAKTKQDSSPVITEIVAWQCSEESYSSHGIKTVKKKKKTFIDDVGEGQVGEMATASKNIGEPLEKIPEIPAGIEIQPVNSIDLTDDSITQRKKRKKRKRQKVVREENMDVEALLVETTEQVEAPNTQDSEQQAAEVVLVRKPKKKKGRIKTHQEEETSKNASVSLRLDLIEMTTSNTPSTRSETGGIGEEEGVGGSEPVKKKKKKRKRKELENDGSWSVSHGLLHLDDSHWQNTKQTRVVKEASSSGQNDTNETNKCERTKDDRSESSQQVLQSEDTIQPNGRKKKKKKKKKQWVETDIEVYPEIVEHELWQESGSPSEPSEAIIEKEKKKKNRKDTVDRGGNQILDVVPKLFAAEESRDALDTCHAKKDSISSSGGALLVHIKKKKQVRDPDNDLDALGAEKVAVSGKSNWCSWTDSAKLKKKRKRDHL